MNIRRFLHVLAIMFSSLLSMVTHGKAADAPLAKKKKSESSLSRSDSKDAVNGSQSPPPGDNPPQHISPALMASAESAGVSMFGPMTAVQFHNTQVQPVTPPARTTTDAPSRYPWKYSIVTTTFWVGELPTKNNPVPNTASSWDRQWATNYGGFDNPSRAGRKDFIPANFTPRQNPFYIALPYNDMERTGFKPEASTVVPWFKKDYKDPMQSVCKDRWIEIRYGSKVVYAQWEDCGPFRTDHWEYVFGNERPKPNLNHGAGLDVSPAVRDYLGMNDSDVTDWRFVDFDEVPPGPWSLYGENNTFVINARKQTERVVMNQVQESRRLEQERDRAFQQNPHFGQ